MIGERLDDPAVGDPAAATLANHASELGLERFQARDTTLDLLKLAPRNVVCGLARPFRVIR